MKELYGFCQQCGRRFKQYRPFQKYCSTKCRNKANKSKYVYIKNRYVTKKCKYCGKEFETNDSKKKFCCNSCYEQFSRRRYKPKNLRKVVCEICGKEFETGHQYKKYCSKECYDIAAKRRQNKYKEQKESSNEK